MWKDGVTTRRKPRAKEPERQRVSLNLSAALFQNAIVPSGSFVQGFILIVRNRGNTEHSSEKRVVLRIGVSARLSETHPVKRRNDSQPPTPLGCGVGTKIKIPLSVPPNQRDVLLDGLFPSNK